MALNISLLIINFLYQNIDVFKQFLIFNIFEEPILAKNVCVCVMCVMRDSVMEKAVVLKKES